MIIETFKQFYRKYLFFLNNSTVAEAGIIANLSIFLGLIFYFLSIDLHDNNEVLQYYDTFFGLFLMKISTFPLFFNDMKANYNMFFTKMLKKNLKYEELEMITITNTLVYTFFLINFLFVIDWDLMFNSNHKLPTGPGVVVLVLAFFQYRQFKKANRKNKPAHVRKKEKMEQKWWQRIF